MKIKTSATERLDRRYVLIEAPDMESIEKAIVKLSGALGLAQCAPVVVEDMHVSASKNLIVAVNRDSVDLLRSALELGETNMKIIRVSGTVKGLKR